MKLLLDEMWAPEVAHQLRRRGFDVVAVQEHAEFRGLSDEMIFALAQQEGRTIVTENVSDFRRIAQETEHGHHNHAGLILTSNHKYSRHDDRSIGRIVTALADLLLSDAVIDNLEDWL